jgi:hypothetical protein
MAQAEVAVRSAGADLVERQRLAAESRQPGASLRRELGAGGAEQQLVDRDRSALELDHAFAQQPLVAADRDR